jgi:gamma-butyrobetaine hydroxylase
MKCPAMIAHSAERVSITWQNQEGSSKNQEFYSLWLYDNSPAHRDPVTGQRLLDVTDLPEAPRISQAVCVGTQLQVQWEDGHSADFAFDWLHSFRPQNRVHSPCLVSLWRADRAPLERLDYSQVTASDKLRLKWLKAIASQGLAILSRVPRRQGEVQRVAAGIGWVRETDYGRIFDVRSVAAPNNLAYTNRALGLHTDNPYREPVPGLQLLHCLKDDTSGGASLFADGFAAAAALRECDRQAFDTLASTPVWFEFRDAQCHLRAERTVIECGRNTEVAAIHYNNRSMAPLCMPPEDVLSFYRAIRLFGGLLHDPEFMVSTKMEAGELVAFDNRRVLHGRTGFSSAVRRLQGCYVDRDGLMSNIAVLERSCAIP